MNREQYAAWWEADELTGAQQTEACMNPVWRRHFEAALAAAQQVPDRRDAA